MPDNPIVWASESFLELTQYSRDQVLGRNCRFLQGPATSSKRVAVIRRAVAGCAAGCAARPAMIDPRAYH